MPLKCHSSLVATHHEATGIVTEPFHLTLIWNQLKAESTKLTAATLSQ